VYLTNYLNGISEILLAQNMTVCFPICILFS